MEDHVYRKARLGNRGSLNVRIGIRGRHLYDRHGYADHGLDSLTTRSHFVLMPVETLGEAWSLSWRLHMRCLDDGQRGLKHGRACDFRSELDLQTLVCTRGRGFPLALLASRLKCPRCGCAQVAVLFDPPTNALAAPDSHARKRRPRQPEKDTRVSFARWGTGLGARRLATRHNKNVRDRGNVPLFDNYFPAVDRARAVPAQPTAAASIARSGADRTIVPPPASLATPAVWSLARKLARTFARALHRDDPPTAVTAAAAACIVGTNEGRVMAKARKRAAGSIVAYGRRPRAGEILCHNPVVPATPTTRRGTSGFRWFSALPGPQWVECPCGWRPEWGTHYASADFVKTLTVD